MSGAAWIILLATAAFLFEVVGVGLILFDIRDSRQQARRLVGRVQTLRVESVVTEQRVPTVHVVGGRQPSLAERVDALERQHREFEERLAERVDALERQHREFEERLMDRLSSVSRELRADARDRTRQVEETMRADYVLLRDVLGDMLAGSLGRRIWGVVLVVVGLAASWAADLVDALAGR